MAHAFAIETARLLAPLTTLGLGGLARYFVEATEREQVREALMWAVAQELDVGILGGGSNLLVGDGGFPGLVVRVATRGLELTRSDGYATLVAQAGESWDDVVELSVSEGLAGLECLAGIPGSTGATPIQNVGAYGQEVSEVIEAVEVLDRADGSFAWLPASACAFAYRASRFKRQPGRFVVLAVRFRLRSDGVPCLRYREVAQALASGESGPSLRDVQRAVRALRSHKGMLIEPGWEPSAGSFFTNPVVAPEQAARVVELALARGLVVRADEVPSFPTAEGAVKLAAAWLIERAGIAKGLRRGAFGVSARHALALVHHGGGTSGELLAFAAEIQEQVKRTFDITLSLEPVCWYAGA